MSRKTTFEWTPKDGRTIEEVVDKSQPSPTEEVHIAVAYIKHILPTIQDHAEIWGVPNHVVALALELIADSYRAKASRKEES